MTKPQVHGSSLIDYLQCLQELKQSEDDIFSSKTSGFFLPAITCQNADLQMFA